MIIPLPLKDRMASANRRKNGKTEVINRGDTIAEFILPEIVNRNDIDTINCKFFEKSVTKLILDFKNVKLITLSGQAEIIQLLINCQTKELVIRDLSKKVIKQMKRNRIWDLVIDHLEN